MIWSRKVAVSPSVSNSMENQPGNSSATVSTSRRRWSRGKGEKPGNIGGRRGYQHEEICFTKRQRDNGGILGRVGISGRVARLSGARRTPANIAT